MGICLIVKSGGGIDTSSATATADKILSGYTIYSNDNKITGSMRNVGNQANTDLNDPNGYHWLMPGTVIQSWGGWHDGTCQLIAQSLESQIQCDIPNQWWCLTGYSYWANGSKYDGAMVNRGTKTWSIGANGSQTIEAGWHNGNGTVKQSINVDTGEWGPTPTTTNQQLCWQGWYYSKNRWCWGNSNLVAGNIKKGVSIFGVSGNYVETKRYIIQNGIDTGFRTLEYIPQVGSSIGTLPAKTISWNNVTWRFLQGHQLVDGKLTYSACTAIRSLSRVISISWSGTTTSPSEHVSSLSFGGQVYADILMEGYGWAANAAYWGVIVVGGTGSSTYLSMIRMNGTGIYPPAGKYGTEYSTASISTSSPWIISSYVSYGPKLASGDVMIGLHQYGIVTTSGPIKRTNIWVRNMWIDTASVIALSN